MAFWDRLLKRHPQTKSLDAHTPPERILEHLAYVAGEIGDIALFSGERVVVGRMEFPEGIGAPVPFRAQRVDAADAALGAGALVHTVYGTEEDRYGFEATVLKRPDRGLWHLSFPTAVTASGNRLTRRHAAEGRWAFYARRHGAISREPTEVLDVSVGGLSLVFPKAIAPGSAALIKGMLEGPGHSRLQVRLTVRHLLEPKGRPNMMMAGCAFTSMEPADYRLVGAILGRFAEAVPTSPESADAEPISEAGR